MLSYYYKIVLQNLKSNECDIKVFSQNISHEGSLKILPFIRVKVNWTEHQKQDNSKYVSYEVDQSP